ncbi:hypothetical protein Tco_0935258 [Tanacetum coccineum]
MEWEGDSDVRVLAEKCPSPSLPEDVYLSSCKLKASWNTGNGMKLMTMPRPTSGLPETHFGKPLVTRTRQSLWICENNGKLSKPKFDYWKKRGLVQVRKLDDSVAQAMQVASSG